jgi:hypothetical protein
MVQVKKQVTDGNKQAAEGYKEEDKNSVAHVCHLESNASFFSCI